MSHLFLFNLPSGNDLVLIFLVALLLFGGKKIPEVMKGIGTGIREFNAAKANVESEIKEGMKAPEKKEIPKKD